MFRHVRSLARNLALAALAAASLLGAGNAQAAFPERPITLIVPWAAGGGTDAVARQIAQMLERDFKQPVNVVNRTGGSGVVGHQAGPERVVRGHRDLGVDAQFGADLLLEVQRRLVGEGQSEDLVGSGPARW